MDTKDKEHYNDPLQFANAVKNTALGKAVVSKYKKVFGDKAKAKTKTKANKVAKKKALSKYDYDQYASPTALTDGVIEKGKELYTKYIDS